MEFQGSPLLSNEISGIDINDEAKNENYSKELNILYNEIREDLSNIDSTGLGKVSENNLLNYLQSKIPPKRNLNVGLFQQLFQDLEREDDAEIDLDDFTREYIRAREELKLNFDTLKKGFDKERNLRGELEQKLQNTKQENFNKNGMSEKSCVSTEIGKVTLLSQIEGDEIFCTVSLDNEEEKKTVNKNINSNLTFTEKFTFPIDSRELVLTYKLFSNANPNESIGEIEVPLFILNIENEEITPESGFKDVKSTNHCTF
jgi:hypothetical protein